MACGFSLSADVVLELIAPLIIREEEQYNQWIAGLVQLSVEERESRKSQGLSHCAGELRGIANGVLQELKEIQSVANCAKELGIDVVTLDADALRRIGLLPR